MSETTLDKATRSDHDRAPFFCIQTCIEVALQGKRLVYNTERELHELLEDLLPTVGVQAVREYRLAPGERPDFFIESSGIAIEVKTKGGIDAHLRQMKRYADHDSVRGVLLITNGSVPDDLPLTLGGKPIAAICIAWGSLL